ncbi:MAG: hypothetical protein CMD83_06730 [Gammaproteobacteria bacterium]|nr:hypothetical protein [Gammaproteobacteria bacterium]
MSRRGLTLHRYPRGPGVVTNRCHDMPSDAGSLDADARARVLHSLATLYRLGIDPGSFDVEEIPARIRERFRSGVRNGRSLASSGFVAGLFNELERTLVTIGETGGRQELVFGWLARWYGDQARLADTLARRTLYPLLSLIAALVMAPVPDLVAGELSVERYVTWTVLEVVAVLWIRGAALSRIRKRRMRFGTALIPVADRDRLEYERDYLALLWLSLAAGVDARSALGTLSRLGADKAWRVAHATASAAMERGEALTQALQSAGLIRRGDNLGVLRAGEASGSLASSLERHLGWLDEVVASRVATRTALAGGAVYAGVMVLAVLVGFDLNDPIGTGHAELEEYGIELVVPE